MSNIFFKKELSLLKNWKIPNHNGVVIKVYGFFVEVSGIQGSLGDLCFISRKQKKFFAEIIKIDGNILTLSCFSEPKNISYGTPVYLYKRMSLKNPKSYLGKIVYVHENFCPEEFVCQDNNDYSSKEQQKITSIFDTGIKAIDGLCTIGKGQKIGIFSSAGLGKTSLLSLIAKNSSSDINIIVLIGERGREIHDFVHALQQSCVLEKTVILVTRSDQIASLKISAARTAMSLAEFFKNEGKSVLFIMDSLSRFAYALQEHNELLCKNTRSYNLSSQLASCIEKSGNFIKGSITSFYSILVDKEMSGASLENMFRSLLDGHIYLDNDFDDRYYPSINISRSLSRVMKDLVSEEHFKNFQVIKSWISEYIEYKELITLGAYVSGSRPGLDKAINKKDDIINLLRQESTTYSSFEETLSFLKKVVSLQ